NSLKITYTFKNSMNADTLINFYDSQAFRDRPLFDVNKDYSRYEEAKNLEGNWQDKDKKNTKKRVTKQGSKEAYYIINKIPNKLPYKWATQANNEQIAKNVIPIRDNKKSSLLTTS
ncbi:hypothetical protein, partial [Mycoplasma sp. 392]